MTKIEHIYCFPINIKLFLSWSQTRLLCSLKYHFSFLEHPLHHHHLPWNLSLVLVKDQIVGAWREHNKASVSRNQHQSLASILFPASPALLTEHMLHAHGRWWLIRNKAHTIGYPSLYRTITAPVVVVQLNQKIFGDQRLAAGQLEACYRQCLTPGLGLESPDLQANIQMSGGQDPIPNLCPALGLF